LYKIALLVVAVLSFSLNTVYGYGYNGTFQGYPNIAEYCKNNVILTPEESSVQGTLDVIKCIMHVNSIMDGLNK